jgi:hypothetical protein
LSKQDQVLEYLNMDENLSKDLVFQDSDKLKESFPEDKFIELSNKDLMELVKDVLQLSTHYYSFRKEESGQLIYETGSDRSRSSIDIWRHVKHFKPNTTIFEVMSTLFELENDLEGNYCDVVERRVFHSPWDLSGWTYFYDSEELDEFGLYFFDWENIHLENQKR